MKDIWYYSKKEKRIHEEKDIISYSESESLNIRPYSDDFKIDLTPFKNLVMLSGDYRNMINLKNVTTVQYLFLLNYNNDLNEISSLQNLMEFSNSLGKFNNLSFLESSILKKVSIFGNPRLVDISGIQNRLSLTEIELDSCKNIPVDHLIRVVCSLHNLEVLKLIKFEFQDIKWVKLLPKLKQLVITDCNVIDGDISPAVNLEYVAIDNRKHYNYRFDNETRTIIPVKPKGIFIPKPEKNSTNTFAIPHFGDLDVKHVDEDYETDMEMGDLKVILELHFEETSTTKIKLKRLIKLINEIESDNKIILDLFKKDFNDKGVVRDYFDYYSDEAFEPNEVAFWHNLQLKRVAFYPNDDENYGVYDYGIDEINPYVLSLKINQKGKIVGCEMES